MKKSNGSPRMPGRAMPTIEQKTLQPNEPSSFHFVADDGRKVLVRICVYVASEKCSSLVQACSLRSADTPAFEEFCHEFPAMLLNRMRLGLRVRSSRASLTVRSDHCEPLLVSVASIWV